ncbi:unnamed protein product [Schistosoma rodhaini]|uniref:Leishmanolysin-like peptidase n=1 Tax=Schistosoma rodhaini TaxID=6188 RepID=A0AA85FXV9_9TREM|nr:unnamed protein product [Schistosoma rodhaini]
MPNISMNFGILGEPIDKRQYGGSRLKFIVIYRESIQRHNLFGQFKGCAMGSGGGDMTDVHQDGFVKSNFALMRDPEGNPRTPRDPKSGRPLLNKERQYTAKGKSTEPYCDEPVTLKCYHQKAFVHICAVVRFTQRLPPTEQYFSDPSQGGTSALNDRCPLIQVTTLLILFLI